MYRGVYKALPMMALFLGSMAKFLSAVVAALITGS